MCGALYCVVRLFVCVHTGSVILGPAKPISANVGEGSLRLKPVFLARSRTGHSMELSVGAFGATPTVVHVTALPADWQTDANTPMAAAEPIVEAFWEGEVHGAPAPESTPVTAGGARKRRRTCTAATVSSAAVSQSATQPPPPARLLREVEAVPPKHLPAMGSFGSYLSYYRH